VVIKLILYFFYFINPFISILPVYKQLWHWQIIRIEPSFNCFKNRTSYEVIINHLVISYQLLNEAKSKTEVLFDEVLKKIAIQTWWFSHTTGCLTGGNCTFCTACFIETKLCKAEGLAGFRSLCYLKKFTKKIKKKSKCNKCNFTKLTKFYKYLRYLNNSTKIR